MQLLCDGLQLRWCVECCGEYDVHLVQLQLLWNEVHTKKHDLVYLLQLLLRVFCGLALLLALSLEHSFQIFWKLLHTLDSLSQLWVSFRVSAKLVLDVTTDMWLQRSELLILNCLAERRYREHSSLSQNLLSYLQRQFLPVLKIHKKNVYVLLEIDELYLVCQRALRLKDLRELHSFFVGEDLDFRLRELWNRGVYEVAFCHFGLKRWRATSNILCIYITTPIYDILLKWSPWRFPI